MKTSRLILAVLVLSSFAAVTASAAEIHVSAAASMKDALTEIVAGYVKVAPEAVILTNFGSSGAQAKQIGQGAPADIFISAHPKWLAFVVKEGKALKAGSRVLAYNKLVFAGRKGRLAVTSLADLKGLQRIALGTPASVPAGQYAEQAMRAAGIYEDLGRDKKLVMAQDVRQALLYADRGEVDGAFVYKTDALLARNAAILLVVPEDLHERIAYPMTLTVSGAANEQAGAFYGYLSRPKAREILQKYGFETAE